jgi:RNA methyltransferase, TrmH family
MPRQPTRIESHAPPRARDWITVDRRRHPLVGRFRDARDRQTDVMLLDGPHLAAEALASRLDVEVAAFSARALDDPEIASLADALGAAGSTLAHVSNDVLAAMSPARTPSGVVLLAKPPVFESEAFARPAPALVLVAVDVQDPGNVGAIVRVADAAGATGVIAAGASADPLGWKALRGGMGSTFRLPTVRLASAADAARRLHSLGVRVVATVATGGRPIDAIDLTGPTAILLGSEGAGLAPETVRGADETATIPMRAPVSSLNVSTAAAVVAYAAFWQRKGARQRR